MILFALLSGLCFANESVDENKNENLYNIYCSSCHTKEEKVVNFSNEKTKEEMIEAIRSGETPMPTYSFLFTDQELISLIEYMESLSK